MSNRLVFNPEDHSYLLNGSRVPSVTQALGVMDAFRDVPEYRLELGRARGTTTHLVCEYYDRKQLDERTVDPIIVPYFEAWKKFKKDFGFSFPKIETKVYSTKYRFAGTLDRIGKDKSGELYIIDLKTGSALSAITALQIAAYQFAWNEMFPGKKIKKRLGVLLMPSGNYRVQAYTEKGDLNLFFAALSIYNFKAKNHI